MKKCMWEHEKWSEDEDISYSTTIVTIYMLFFQVYNVVDSGDTTQGHLSSIISEIFDINHDYWGTAFSTLAKVDHSHCT
jgi:hypothetical protein